MAEVKWIKITTTMFDDEKIKIIESMPDADSILIIWIKLLTLAGKTNTNGFIFLAENIPYTDEMLSTLFNRPLNTVRLALETFKRFGMIDYDEQNFLHISNWDKHQNIDGLDKIREQTKKRVASYRKRQRQLPESNVTVTRGNATDIELDIEEERDKEVIRVPYQKILNLYLSICISFPKVRALSKEREEHIGARYKQYKCDIEVFRELFTKAESSIFLKGDNDRKWKATFDWLMNETNMAKVLEEKYKNKPKSSSSSPTVNLFEKTFADDI